MQPLANEQFTQSNWRQRNAQIPALLAGAAEALPVAFRQPPVNPTGLLKPHNTAPSREPLDHVTPPSEAELRRTAGAAGRVTPYAYLGAAAHTTFATILETQARNLTDPHAQAAAAHLLGSRGIEHGFFVLGEMLGDYAQAYRANCAQTGKRPDLAELHERALTSYSTTPRRFAALDTLDNAEAERTYGFRSQDPKLNIVSGTQSFEPQHWELYAQIQLDRDAHSPHGCEALRARAADGVPALKKIHHAMVDACVSVEWLYPRAILE